MESGAMRSNENRNGSVYPVPVDSIRARPGLCADLETVARRKIEWIEDDRIDLIDAVQVHEHEKIQHRQPVVHERIGVEHQRARAAVTQIGNGQAPSIHASVPASRSPEFTSASATAWASASPVSERSIRRTRKPLPGS